ncbi:MAG: hypothetical protein HYY30_02300 [Chloroflexi bacterium]|nr:hypothetical protein [Chloroflexota bacterium]
MVEISRTIGDAMLDVLRAYGVEYIFSSPGSEWAPVWDALARAKAEERGPVYINTRHEELAVSLAAGYHRRSRKLTALLLHAGVGPLHCGMALRAALHEHVPMVVLVGETAGFGQMPGHVPGSHWQRKLADIGGPAAIVRPFVKRATSVTSREVLLGMLQDACRLALTPPYGPVFLSVPFEYLSGSSPEFEGQCTPPPLPTRADSSALNQVAVQLVQAERPVLLTETAGRNPANVELLVELAELLAIPVAEALSPAFLNFPRNHPLHQGFESKQLLQSADLALLVSTQSPWYPVTSGPKNAKVILIDDNPTHEISPYWGYPVDQVIGGDLNTTLEELIAHVKRLIDGDEGKLVAHRERWSHWQKKHEQQQEELQARALAQAQRKPMDARWVARTIGQVLPLDAIVADETTTHHGLFLRYLGQHVPETYQSRDTGGLGVSLGLALGLKLATPDRLVAAILGDGAFNYNPVLPAFGFAQQFGKPILVILMENQGYVAMKQDLLKTMPDGWSTHTNTFFGSEIEPAPDYVAIAQACGAYGERVEDPGALEGALGRAIKRVEEGQLSLLHLVLDPWNHLPAH